MKIRAVGAELFHADGARDEINNRFSLSWERPWQPVGFNKRLRNLLKIIFIAACWYIH